MTPEMTPHAHAQQKAWVIASELLAPSRAQRHGVYRNRHRNRHRKAAPVVVTTTMPTHIYVLPVVRERLL